MDIGNARISGQNVLELLIKNQPSLLTEKTGNHVNNGANLADFCHDFIDQYAKRLIARKEQE